MFKIVFTAALAGLAAAYTQPTGNAPVGNPISQPGLNSVVPAGDNFTITWEPTTKGTVTLVLLKGPSSNAVPQYPIVEKTPNDGTYVWHVSDSLEPTENAQGYGIQLIDDATGQYQYTTQFGISNADWKASSSSSSSAAATTETPSWTTYTTFCPEETTFTAGGKTYSATKSATITVTDTCTEASTTAAAATTKSASVWAPIGTGASSGIISRPANVTMLQPTAGGYVPTTVATTYAMPSSPATTAAPSPTPYQGAAVANAARGFLGLAAAGLVAMFAL